MVVVHTERRLPAWGPPGRLAGFRWQVHLTPARLPRLQDGDAPQLPVDGGGQRADAGRVAGGAPGGVGRTHCTTLQIRRPALPLQGALTRRARICDLALRRRRTIQRCRRVSASTGKALPGLRS